MTLSLVIDRLSTRRLARSGAGARTDESFEQGFQRGFERGLSYYQTLGRSEERSRAGWGAQAPAEAWREQERVKIEEPKSGSAARLGEAFFIEERSSSGVSLSLWARAQPIALPGQAGFEIGLSYELRAQSDRLLRVYQTEESVARRALAAGGSAICQALYLDAGLAERVGVDFSMELSGSAKSAAGAAADSQAGGPEAPGLPILAGRWGAARGEIVEPAYLPGELEEPEWAASH